ncbi:MAG TPA: GIY-YIG nuclease family protein [Noviherbaspirillum sp.]|uniref:GIY-YIG nuclease family protein n=1 Tax=Noviherbaspirillum sp. TaxID=1926288 RepID=UPI002D699E9D|nr:GIY-YIG nuclease family protein [Noviherbaspirillum sp.]HYD94802.1 GIY-YIG nuclease family protein [Noviherbaspirillum sp.]
MSSISASDRAFLAHHNIPLSQVFDAKGRTIGECKAMMEALAAIIAINAVPCKKGGHRIRTRSNHCPVCDPAKVSFMRRHVEPGYVYIALSQRGNLVKVGTTIDIDSRQKNLNSYAYGDRRDWQIKHFKKFAKAGEAESKMHSALAAYNVPGLYFREGRWQDCYELFACSEAVALEAFTRLSA